MTFVPRILIVDDEPRMCESLKALLDPYGYDIQTLTSGREATEFLSKHDIDLVLLDIVMPDMDGLQVMEHINAQNLPTLVILITGHGSTKSVISALRKGAFDYLRKPFDDQGLLRTIENALNHRRLERERKNAEDALRLAKFSIDHAGDAVFWMGSDARLFYVNDAACRSLDYSREGLLSMTVHDIDTNLSKKAWPKYWEEIKLRRTFTVESHHCTREGRIFPVETTVNYLEFDGKEFNCTFARDITDRKEAEAALLESKDRYRRITEAVTDYVYTVRMEQGRPVETIHRPACVAVTGYTAENFKENPHLWIQMVEEEDREAVFEQAEIVLSGKKPEPLEHRIIRKDGAMRWVRNTPVPNFDDQGRLLSYDGLIQDVTELKHARELVRYKILFDNVVDGAFIVNMEGRFVEANDMVYKKTGYSKEELMKLTFKDLVDQEQWSSVDAMFETINQEKEVFLELDVRSKKGDRFPVEVSCRLIYYVGELSILGVAKDLTRAKLLQDQLIRSERLAATGQLAASIAHEINSPLQGVTALLNVMRKRYGKDEYLSKDIDLVKGAFESIRNTVRKLLDLNRPGKERKQPVNVNEIIENTVSLAQGHLKNSKVKVQLNLSSRVPEITASPQQLGQVFMNLINNALEAIEGPAHTENGEKKHKAVGGEIDIRTNLRKGHVVISVTDTGPGISDGDLKHLFDPFYTKKKSMGMGIGLSICNGIIEEHNGSIWARNAPDGGAVFKITLPVS